MPHLRMFLCICFHFQVSHWCVLIICHPFLTEMHLILFFETVIEGYEAKRRSGAISIAVSEELIVGAAMQQAYFAQAQSMVNGNLNPCQVQKIDQLTREAQHPKGSTWTEKYGNLALSRDQTPSRAAEQRLQKTHLEGTAKHVHLPCAPLCWDCLLPIIVRGKGKLLIFLLLMED